MSVDTPTRTQVAPGVRVKASFNLYQSDIDALRQLAGERGINVTQALRGAIALARTLMEAARRGDKVVLEGSDGRITQLMFF